MRFGEPVRSLAFPLWLLVSATLLPHALYAKAPTLTHFFPAGVQRGSESTIECFGQFDWPLEVDCPLAKVECESDSGKLKVVVPADLATDRIWIRLYNGEGASAMLPLVVGGLPNQIEVEPNNTPGEAAKLLADGSTGIATTFNGVLEKAGDIDGFPVRLETGDTLVASVEANAAFGAPMDSILQLCTLDGTVLDENHDTIGLDPRIAYTSPRAQTVIARIFAWPSAPNSSIRFHGGSNFVYRLTLTTGPFVSHAREQFAGVEAPRELAIGGWSLPNDIAILPVPLASGEWEQPAISTMQGTNIGIVWAKGLAGSARVRLLPPGQLADKKNEAGRLSVGTSVTGAIDAPKGISKYTLPLMADQRIEIAVEATSFHSPLVPTAKLLDPDGKVVTQVSERGAISDAKLSYKAGKDGDYVLEIGDRFSNGGDDHVFRLSVSELQADFKLSLASESIVVPAGGSLDLPVSIVRTFGSEVGEITITCTDLPAHCTCEPVVSKAEGDSAKKVVLEIASGGIAHSGSIGIHGQSTKTPLSRLALTPAKFGVCFDRLWLTVLPSTDGADPAKKEPAAAK